MWEKKPVCQRPRKAGPWYIPHSGLAHRMAFLRTIIVILELQSFEAVHEHQTHSRIPPVMGNVALEKNVNYDAKK